MKNVLKIISLACIVNNARASEESNRTFPNNFMFGVGTSAYQTEGAWNETGKSENIWDHWIHEKPSRIKNNDTADIACNSYKNVNHILDSTYLSELGVHHYRFSIPWTRILPLGSDDEINMNAIMHYQELLRYLKVLHIKPVITLYYHDLPQSLQDIGGWTNPEMVQYFANFSRICFQYFNENVEYWLTFSDPRTSCRRGYGEGTFAPGINSDGIDEYLCAYTILKAHAAAYHVYKEEFPKLKGKVSIALDMRWSEAATENDLAAVERRNAFDFGLYADPIYKGNWPQSVIERIGNRSKNENITISRLPEFTEDEINYINGTSDFMAVNLYYTHIVADIEEADFGDPSYEKDMKVNTSLDSTWQLSENGQPIVPSSARKALVWLKETYNDPQIFIAENGVSDKNDLDDVDRISYLQGYLNAILDAIIKDEVNVIAYTYWDFLDSFEWTDGYSYQFGLYHTEFKHVEKFRSEKRSVTFYNKLIKTFKIPEEHITTSTNKPESTTQKPESTTKGAATNIMSRPVLLLSIMFTFKLLF